MGSTKMIYLGSKLDKISDNLNILLNRYDIDFDIIFSQISNIYFNRDKFQLSPYPCIISELQRSPNFYIKYKIDNLKFPILLGNINKYKIYNRVEKIYFHLDLDTVLILNEDNDFYYIYDSDIAPYIKLSKNLLLDNLSQNIIIGVKDDNIALNNNLHVFEKNIKNIYSIDNVGSSAYLEISDSVSNILSKNKLSLYFSVKNIVLLMYKMVHLSKEFDKNIVNFLQIEIEFLNKIIYDIAYKQNIKILKEYFISLYKNRKELEEYAKKYSS